MKTKRRVHRCTRKSDGASRLNRDEMERRKGPVGSLSRAFRLFKVRILIYTALHRIFAPWLCIVNLTCGFKHRVCRHQDV